MQTKTTKPAMEVKELFFSYGSNKILKGASLEIERGKITTIMGANGCGKSTLFSLMTKNLTPGRGKILLNGRNIRDMQLSEFARKVSIVHQYNTSSDDITVERLVGFGRTPHRKLFLGYGEEDTRLIEWAMEVTHIDGCREREVSRLSVLREKEDFDGADLTDAAKEGDAIAMKTLDYCMGHLARGLAIAAHIIDPDIFLIGGGMAKAGQLLIDVIQKHYVTNHYLTKEETQIRLASLGNDAGIYGAAKMIIDA